MGMQIMQTDKITILNFLHFKAFTFDKTKLKNAGIKVIIVKAKKTGLTIGYSYLINDIIIIIKPITIGNQNIKIRATALKIVKNI